MVAVVDHHVEQRIMIGPAAASRRAGGLVYDDGDPARRQAHGGGEPGESRADDVDGTPHQMKA